jgi:type IV pilus assembly protein PilV
MQLNSCRPGGRAAAGFTLLEVLVAMVVLSIGLLGLSGLQTSSLRNNHSALQRSQATMVSNDIIDRIRANRETATLGNYDINYGTAPTTASCSSGCTALQVAQLDVAEWRTHVERLPGGQSELDVTTAGVATVKVRWADARDSANKLEIITRSQI